MSAKYDYMEFRFEDGTTRTLSADGLSITFSNGEIKVTNTAGENIEIAATSISSMQFTNDSAVDSLNLEEMNDFDIYSTSGLHLGKFVSIEAARNTLSNGVYMVKNSNGKTFKVVIHQ